MKRELTVGVVFAALVGVLLLVTIWVKHPGFFEKGVKFPLTARFREVGGLKPGDEVWVYGTSAGRVDSIKPDGTGKVVVVMKLFEDPVMRENAEVKLSARSALGGAVVSIHPGTPDKPLAGDRVFDGQTVSEPFKEIAEAVAALRGPAREFVDNARKVSADLAKHSEKIAENLDGFTENARVLTDDLRAGKGTLGQLLHDDKLYGEMRDAVANLKQVTDDANHGGGTLDVLLHDKTLAADVKEIASRARSITADLDEGRGTFGRLLKDPKLYDDLAATAKDLREVADDARAGKGLLGKLLYDQKFAQRFDDISENVAEVTGKLRRGEGTLGKLIQDDTLYTDLRSALKSLGGGVEDARENAPILTFAGFLFSGF